MEKNWLIEFEKVSQFLPLKLGEDNLRSKGYKRGGEREGGRERGWRREREGVGKEEGERDTMM